MSRIQELLNQCKDILNQYSKVQTEINNYKFKDSDMPENLYYSNDAYKYIYKIDKIEYIFENEFCFSVWCIDLKNKSFTKESILSNKIFKCRAITEDEWNKQKQNLIKEIEKI